MTSGGATPILRALVPFTRLERSGPCWELRFSRGAESTKGGGNPDERLPAAPEASAGASAANPVAVRESARRPQPLQLPAESADGEPVAALGALSLSIDRGGADASAASCASAADAPRSGQVLEAPLLDIDALKPAKLGSFGANAVYRTRHPKARAPSNATLTPLSYASSSPCRPFPVASYQYKSFMVSPSRYRKRRGHWRPEGRSSTSCRRASSWRCRWQRSRGNQWARQAPLRGAAWSAP